MKFILPALSAVVLASGVMLNPASAQTPAAPQPAAAPAAPAVPNPPKELRGARYCEVIPVLLTFSGLKAQVFNTLGHSTCPETEWKGLEDMSLRRHFGAVTVILNGPRYFIMDRIIPKGATAKGEVITLNGISMESRAELSLSLFELLDKPFTEHTVDRETVYVFDAGKPTFRLTSPEGFEYVMQSYAQIVDSGLTYDQLPTLGSRLKLPEGWKFSAVTPATDLVLKVEGKAVVVQDNLKNTYQKVQ